MSSQERNLAEKLDNPLGLEVGSVDASSEGAPHPGAHRSTFHKRYAFWTARSVISVWLLNGTWLRLQTRFYTPHESLYENKTLAQVSDLQEVVRPLIDEDQLFDAVATVWAMNQRVDRSWISGNDEEILFSEPIFRGVTLKDKSAHAQVNLSIPLQAFEAEVLENYDLRASFILLPQSPSLLDGFLIYHSWRPFYWITTVDMSPPQDRLRSGHVLEGMDDLRKQAIDSYGITIPLLDFNPVESACGKGSNKLSNPAPNPLERRAKYPIESTKGKPALENHPFVVTRTDLRIVKMTELYNARRYDSVHRALAINVTLNGCSGYISEDSSWGWRAKPQDVRNCRRSFRLRANMETKIEIKASSQENDLLLSQEWAYAPFMDTIPRSWGPMDLIPMPVNREGCPTEAQKSAESGSLNVTWNVALSFPSPGQIFLAEGVVEALDAVGVYGPTTTLYRKALAQSLAQHIHWLHGHKFSETTHIGRSISIRATVFVLRSIILPRLNIDYWNTRSSTVGISLLGSTSMAIGGIISIFIHQYGTWKEESFQNMAGEMATASVFFTVLAIYTIALIVIATFRPERVNAFPFLKARDLTRAEKASFNTEVHGRIRRLATISASTLLVDVAATALQDRYVIVPRVCPVPEDETLTWQGVLDSTKGLIPGLFHVLGGVYQLNLNYQLKAFVGQYKSAAWLVLLVFCLECIKNIPWVVGELPSSDPLTLADLVYFTPLAVGVVQSVVYPEVRQDFEERHTD